MILNGFESIGFYVYKDRIMKFTNSILALTTSLTFTINILGSDQGDQQAIIPMSSAAIRRLTVSTQVDTTDLVRREVYDEGDWTVKRDVDIEHFLRFVNKDKCCFLKQNECDFCSKPIVRGMVLKSLGFEDIPSYTILHHECYESHKEYEHKKNCCLFGCCLTTILCIVKSNYGY